jgi:hypothetical protein
MGNDISHKVCKVLPICSKKNNTGMPVCQGWGSVLQGLVIEKDTSLVSQHTHDVEFALVSS